MNFISPEILKTADGSHSLFRADINETYHSRHGAYQESDHVYIKQGLWPCEARFPKAEPIKILEVGFGTGLNAMLTIQAAEALGRKVHYTTLEPYPLHPSVVEKLNYDSLFPELPLGVWRMVHDSVWGKDVQISEWFTLHKIALKLEDCRWNNDFHLVYFDAFAPNKQADMWQVEQLQRCYEAMVANGLLVTYCAQGQFKRNLKQVGFQVDCPPGPPYKKEMVSATKVVG